MQLDIGTFLSTLSLRRATNINIHSVATSSISIHALLAESDRVVDGSKSSIEDFYPRSPCGERRFCLGAKADSVTFLSTLSLRRATRFSGALRATENHFYPRSPCGERHNRIFHVRSFTSISIHALLAESDSVARVATTVETDFYPRSPCGERPV